MFFFTLCLEQRDTHSGYNTDMWVCCWMHSVLFFFMRGSSICCVLIVLAQDLVFSTLAVLEADSCSNRLVTHHSWIWIIVFGDKVQVWVYMNSECDLEVCDLRDLVSDANLMWSNSRLYSARVWLSIYSTPYLHSTSSNLTSIWTKGDRKMKLNTFSCFCSCEQETQISGGICVSACIA